MLTGKCKKDFKEWLRTEDLNTFVTRTGDNWDDEENFPMLPPSMQWGVYQDFFDAKGIAIEVWTYDLIEFGVSLMDSDNNFDELIYDPIFHTRKEAHKAAIEKANELYNENYKQ